MAAGYFISAGRTRIRSAVGPREHPRLGLSQRRETGRLSICMGVATVNGAGPADPPRRRTEYSCALTTRPRNLDLANRIVARTLEIIAYLQPDRWWMENPDTGLLKRQALVRDLAYVRVDYCRFSAWGYRKRTRVWYGARRWMCTTTNAATGTAVDPTQPLSDRLCLRWECTNLLGDGTLRHRVHLSCNIAGISVSNPPTNQ